MSTEAFTNDQFCRCFTMIRPWHLSGSRTSACNWSAWSPWSPQKSPPDPCHQLSYTCIIVCHMPNMEGCLVMRLFEAAADPGITGTKDGVTATTHWEWFNVVASKYSQLQIPCSVIAFQHRWKENLHQPCKSSTAQILTCTKNIHSKVNHMQGNPHSQNSLKGHST